MEKTEAGVFLKDSVAPPLNVEISRILNVGHHFSGEGFDDKTEGDINEIIYEYEPEDFNEKELILLAIGSQSASNVAEEDILRKISVHQFQISS